MQSRPTRSIRIEDAVQIQCHGCCLLLGVHPSKGETRPHFSLHAREVPPFSGSLPSIRTVGGNPSGSREDMVTLFTIESPRRHARMGHSTIQGHRHDRPHQVRGRERVSMSRTRACEGSSPVWRTTQQAHHWASTRGLKGALTPRSPPRGCTLAAATARARQRILSTERWRRETPGTVLAIHS